MLSFSKTENQRKYEYNNKYRCNDECKSQSQSTVSSLSPPPSPTPTVLMSNLKITKQKTPIFNHLNAQKNNDPLKRSKKRKLDEVMNNNNNGNCLRKVTLSDGTVCYTMAPSASSPSSSSSASLSMSMKQPPTKKMRTNSYLANIGKVFEGTIKTKKTPTNSSKSKLIYAQTMPAPTNDHLKNKHRNNNKIKRRRRHSDDWTSTDNLLASLKKQERIEQEIFPYDLNGNVPYVNLKEMFHGVRTIRVHKREREINERRRETKIFT